jgi:hypothetical protein
MLTQGQKIVNNPHWIFTQKNTREQGHQARQKNVEHVYRECQAAMLIGRCGVRDDPDRPVRINARSFGNGGWHVAVKPR